MAQPSSISRQLIARSLHLRTMFVIKMMFALLLAVAPFACDIKVTQATCESQDNFIRAMMQAGIEIGFDALTATKIAEQTVKGAAELLKKGGKHPEEEIDKVTTPKGCTISGLNEMEHRGFSSSLIKGILNSFHKIEQ